jgi:hypothetical protein
MGLKRHHMDVMEPWKKGPTGLLLNALISDKHF